MTCGRPIHEKRRIHSGIIHWIEGLLTRRRPVVPGKGQDTYFHFGTKKIVQAASVLLQCRAERQMSYLRLLKLLYIADRESLKETGWPIVGTEPVAMDHGPVHSKVLDLVKGNRRLDRQERQQWSDHIRTQQMDVILIRDPGTLSLSPYEITKLRDVCLRYESADRFGVRDETHEFPEWAQNHTVGTSRPIPFEDIIRAVGRGDDLEEILADAEEANALDDLLGTSA
jgi:hypothetical protein